MRNFVYDVDRKMIKRSAFSIFRTFSFAHFTQNHEYCRKTEKNLQKDMKCGILLSGSHGINFVPEWSETVGILLGTVLFYSDGYIIFDIWKG